VISSRKFQLLWIQISRLTLFAPGLFCLEQRLYFCAEVPVKKVLLPLALLLPIPAVSVAQTVTTVSASPRKAITLAGQISNDGKTLVGNNDELWTIVNPGAVAGHEGQQVTVKCQLSPDKSAIHVFVLKQALAEALYVTHHADSAFRR
jgi:hypothetical protein